jgi:hypothetical protein
MDKIHPAPREFSDDQLTADPVLRYFHYADLPAALQSASAPFCDLANMIVTTLPRNAERSVALRKLLEAKDAAVRANVGAAAVASGGTWFDPLQSERRELSSRYDKIVAFINDGYPGVETTEDHALINQQALAMREYLTVLDQRIAAARPGDVAAPLDEPREVGGADPVRDGPIKFGD